MRLRKGSWGENRGRRAIAAGLIVVLAGFAGACDGSPTDTLVQASATEAIDAESSVVPGDFAEGLGLTDDQLAAVSDLMENYAAQGREPGMLWYAAADLHEVLTSDQIAAIEARRTEVGAETNARRRGRGGPGARDGETPRQQSGDRESFGSRGPADALDLSEEQLAQMKEIRESFAPQMEEIREAIRDGSLARDDARTRLEEIREEMHQATLEILTAEQVALVEEHRAEAEDRRAEMSEQRETRREEERAAMVAALELTDEQVAALDALRERPQGEERPSAEALQTRREEIRQAVLDILDEKQEEIWILHDSLSESFARRTHSRGGDRSAGRRLRGSDPSA